MKCLLPTFCLCLSGWLLPAAAADGEGVLNRIADIRLLSRAEAQKALPVKVRGVVTLKDLLGRPPEWFVVDDGHSSIWVQVRLARDGSIWREGDARLSAIKRGDLIELEGITHPGGFAPVIVPSRCQTLGTQAMPKPRELPLEDLLSGAADCQLVTLGGVVQAVNVPPPGKDRVMLHLEARGQTFHVIAESWPDIQPKDLIDAEVRVTGIFSPVSNFRAEMVGLRVRIEGPMDFQLLKPPPANPFRASRVSLDRLRPFSASTNNAHRSVITGVVTYHSSGDFLFIQDGEFGVRVESPDTKTAVGDLVEVAGFVDMTRRVASLHGARVRQLGQGTLPQARKAEPEDVLHPQKVILWERVAETDLDGRLVTMEGKLSRIEWEEDRTYARLQIRFPDGSTTAHLRHLSADQAVTVESWQPGSRLNFTGVCEIVFVGTSTPLMPKPASFRLWLRSPSDVRVLHAPPWWNPARLTQALILSLLGLALAFGWGFTLRQSLRKRTMQLEKAMRHHRDTELEYDSAQQERQRLAADLHDGLQQMIAGVSYRLEAAMGELLRNPAEARTQLAATRRALTATKSGLRECLWGLRQVEEAHGDFAALLRHVVETCDHWPERAVVLETTGQPFPMSRDVMGGLLLLMQEAVSNALRHGAAKKVWLRLHYTPNELQLEIADDGKGFDPESAPGTPEGHYGLEGMRQRMGWLGGDLRITSQPGQGTNICVSLPREKAHTHSPENA